MAALRKRAVSEVLTAGVKERLGPGGVHRTVRPGLSAPSVAPPTYRTWRGAPQAHAARNHVQSSQHGHAIAALAQDGQVCESISFAVKAM